MSDDCLCLGCKNKVIVNDKVNVNVNDEVLMIMSL